MRVQLERRLLDELEQLPLIYPHTHNNPHAPASETLADILGYHYYTELAHSAGLPRERIEEPGLEPRELVSRLAPFLDHLDNTVQVSWLVEMCREFFGFEAGLPDVWEKEIGCLGGFAGDAGHRVQSLDGKIPQAGQVGDEVIDPVAAVIKGGLCGHL